MQMAGITAENSLNLYWSVSINSPPGSLQYGRSGFCQINSLTKSPQGGNKTQDITVFSKKQSCSPESPYKCQLQHCNQYFLVVAISQFWAQNTSDLLAILIPAYCFLIAILCVCVSVYISVVFVD